MHCHEVISLAYLPLILLYKYIIFIVLDNMSTDLEHSDTFGE